LTVFIPYHAKGSKWQGNELRYVLRSMEKNFLFDFDVVLCGDKPEWVQCVGHVPFERRYPDNALKRHGGNKLYENFFDTLYKLQFWTRWHKGEFLYTYDDTHVLKPVHDIVHLRKITENVAMEKFTGRAEIIYDRSRHGRTINTAIALSDGRYIYETHSMRWYDCEKVQEIFDSVKIFDLSIPPAFATLYYNWHYKEPYVKLCEGNKIKAGFYLDEGTYDSFSSGSVKAIQEACQDKYFINYNDMGFNENIRRFLEDSFPDKSKYEKA